MSKIAENYPKTFILGIFGAFLTRGSPENEFSKKVKFIKFHFLLVCPSNVPLDSIASLVVLYWSINKYFVVFFMINISCNVVTICFVSVNVSKCTGVFVKLFICSLVFVFFGTGSSSACYCLRSLIQIRPSYLNFLHPGLGLWLNVPNCFLKWLLLISALCIGAVVSFLFFEYRVSCTCGYILFLLLCGLLCYNTYFYWLLKILLTF